MENRVNSVSIRHGKFHSIKKPKDKGYVHERKREELAIPHFSLNNDYVTIDPTKRRYVISKHNFLMLI